MAVTARRWRMMMAWWRARSDASHNSSAKRRRRGGGAAATTFGEISYGSSTEVVLCSDDGMVAIESLAPRMSRLFRQHETLAWQL
uniref:OSJNBa0009K15.19 protein n=1 Tax=Oryza sativa subsp. japonica TaxID=39947 RepID=Q7XLJ1_ORYSJ|nr:OSJNBa0009K15.19 [Oryza sativa Japonica Group]